MTTTTKNIGRDAFVRKHDEKWIGTEDYQGHAYFWGQEYKFTLRGDWLGMGGIDILHPDGRRYGTTDFANENGEYDEDNPIENRNYENACLIAVTQMRKTIHDEWLARGLDFLGVSTEHKAIVDHYGWKAVRQIADAVGGTVSKGNFHAERKV